MVLIAIQNVTEHHEETSKYVCGVSVPVLGADKHAIIPLVSMEARITSKVVGRQSPVHSRLVVNLEIPELLDLLSTSI